MPKLLLFLAIVVVAVLLVRRLLNIAGGRGTHAPPDAQPPAETPAAPDAKLVRCVQCGAFVPKTDALPAGSGFRCGGAGCAASH
jgi:hypothetical protein